MSTDYLKQMLSESAPKPVVIAGNEEHIDEEHLPFVTLGSIFEAAPVGCSPEHFGEALLVASEALAEDTETDSTVRFEQLTGFLEKALSTARALRHDAQSE